MLTKLWAWLRRVFGAEKAQTPTVAKPKRKRKPKAKAETLTVMRTSAVRKRKGG